MDPLLICFPTKVRTITRLSKKSLFQRLASLTSMADSKTTEVMPPQTEEETWREKLQESAKRAEGGDSLEVPVREL